jgi:hypothetical protein
MIEIKYSLHIIVFVHCVHMNCVIPLVGDVNNKPTLFILKSGFLQIIRFQGMLAK